MRIALVHNAKSGTADKLDAVLAALRAAGHAVTSHALTPELDLPALAAHCDRLAVAGGDGTIHAVANALGPNVRVPILVVPLGTGNDLCRTLAVPLDPVEAVKLIDGGRVRRIDMIRVEGDRTGYFVNAATGGFSGKVAADVTPAFKQSWGPLAYLRGAAGAMADPPTYKLTFRRDGRAPETIDAVNVVVANGRNAAGGVLVAPGASPEDGKLDVLIVRRGDFLDHAIITARLMAGDYHADNRVLLRRARTLELWCDEPIPMSFDGELCEGRHFRFTVVRNAMPVLTGRNYRKNPRSFARQLFAMLAAVLALGRRVSLVTDLAFLAFALLAVGVATGALQPANEFLRAQLSPRGNANLLAVAELATDLGHWLAVLVAAGLVFAFWKTLYRPRGALVLLALVFPLEIAMKWLFAEARPMPLGSIVPVAEYSFPSGHALRATAIYGALALALWQARRRTLAFGALLLIPLVIWTRLYIGVHWPADTLGGLLLGVALLGLHPIFIRRGKGAPVG